MGEVINFAQARYDREHRLAQERYDRFRVIDGDRRDQVEPPCDTEDGGDAA